MVCIILILILRMLYKINYLCRSEICFLLSKCLCAIVLPCVDNMGVGKEA